MLIGDKYKIEADKMDITLFEKRMSKATKEKPSAEKWVPVSYHRDVKQALHELVDREVKSTHLWYFETVVEKVEELHKLIENLKVGE